MDDAETDSRRLDQERELRQIEQQHGSAARTANAASSRAGALRSSADDISVASAPLIGVLNAVRALHTNQTWEGDSAIRSRIRLDGHEERCAATLSMIDGLLTDLDGQARVQASIAANARAEQQRLSPRMNALQHELGTAVGSR